MKYKQLTAADRKAIEVLLKHNHTKKEAAKELGKDYTTICREVKNRSTPKGYFADVAELNYQSKRKRSRKKKKINTHRKRNYIWYHLEIGWSPEQISGRMKYERIEWAPSVETIYKFIYEDSLAVKESWYQYLRYGRKEEKTEVERT